MSDTERAEQRRDRRAARRQERVKREQRVVEAPLAPPSANSGLLEVFRRRYLLSLLVRREISARYQGSFLGLFWS
jgi:ABC-2 type transport system permease protein